MQATPADFRHWHSPDPSEVGQDHIEFLRLLAGPTWITLDGIDQGRQRAIVTLLHGNEPSGLKAIHDFLASGEKPTTNLGIFVVSVNAALHPPILSHRFLPAERDFNRCFGTPGSTDQEILAAKILTTLARYSPEAIVDTHNTSAHSEPFAVVTSDEKPLRQLSQMFTHRLVVLDLSLGTLIEQSLGCPVMTIEFGGLLDPRADQLAKDSLSNFIRCKHLFHSEVDVMQILKHPLRLEIDESSRLHYASSVQDEADITIFNTIDQMNFSHLEAGTRLGWLGAEGLSPLRVISRDDTNHCDELFAEHESFLINRVPMTIFMATTDPYIASKDCLMYLCPTES